MITPKTFILILIGTFLLGFATMFLYHIINKPEPIIEIESKENKILQFKVDSLLTEEKIKGLIIDELKEVVIDNNKMIDSLITKNHDNGKAEKKTFHNSNASQLSHWNDSVLRANKLK